MVTSKNDKSLSSIVKSTFIKVLNENPNLTLHNIVLDENIKNSSYYRSEGKDF